MNVSGPLSKRTRDSIACSGGLIGLFGTLFTIIGISLDDFFPGIKIRESAGIVIAVAIILCFGIYYGIGIKYRRKVKLTIRNTTVEISCDDIFNTSGYRVIGCDSHFSTDVDDIVISKKSLHGQFLLDHGNVEEVNEVVEAEAQKRNLQKNENGQYDFPLGSIIRYKNSDEQVYLLLAMTKLNEQYESHTNMALYEQMLMAMWKEISRVYASEDVVLPLLGSGITRFDDGPKDKADLLRCILCTLNASGVSLNSNVKVVLFGDIKEIPLYEYKDLFRIIPAKRKK